MADWHGTCRSNYFRVKDETAFLEMLELFDAHPIEKQVGEEILHGFYSEDEYGSIPTSYPEGDEEPTSILECIADHLVTNEVCVILEAGAEKARYITGLAIAIHSSGRQIDIRLSDIYALARTEFGANAGVTEAVS
ncbi:hypothetical protein [Rhizobium arsenicireducens]